MGVQCENKKNKIKTNKCGRVKETKAYKHTYYTCILVESFKWIIYITIGAACNIRIFYTYLCVVSTVQAFYYMYICLKHSSITSESTLVTHSHCAEFCTKNKRQQQQ